MDNTGYKMKAKWKSEVFSYQEITEYRMTEYNSKFHEDYIASHTGVFTIEDKNGKYCHINHTYRSYSKDYIAMAMEMKKRVSNALSQVST